MTAPTEESTNNRRALKSTAPVFVVAIAVAAVLLESGAGAAGVDPSRELLIRCDDVGTSHMVTPAVRELSLKIKNRT